jgi:peptidoglycan/xylan/chitin deacetylase (PgdA/CDA1 family)
MSEKLVSTVILSVRPSDPGGTAPATPAGRSASTAAAAGVGTRLSRARVAAKYAGVAPSSWGLQARGIVQSLGTAEPVVALTFDACGGPTATSAGCGYDKALIDLLRQHQARATLFLNARWIAVNPATTDELIRDPLFEIGNHGTRHLPLSVTGRAAYGQAGTRSPTEAYDEVAGNHDNLNRLLGHPPGLFRSGTAYCDDVGVAIAAELGERVVSFTINGDAGTTFTARQVEAALAAAGPGDIVISHFNRPPHQTAEGYAVALPKLLARGLRTVTLSEYLH